VARMGGKRNTHSIWFGKPEDKRTLGWPGREWGDDIKMTFKGLAYDNVDWIHEVQSRNQWRVVLTWLWTSVYHKSLGISWPPEWH
jgi:hypothetical protein